MLTSSSFERASTGKDATPADSVCPTRCWAVARRIRSASRIPAAASPSTTTANSSPPMRNGSSPARHCRASVREGGSRLCFVRDPDGYRIELIERGP